MAFTSLAANREPSSAAERYGDTGRLSTRRESKMRLACAALFTAALLAVPFISDAVLNPNKKPGTPAVATLSIPGLNPPFITTPLTGFLPPLGRPVGLPSAPSFSITLLAGSASDILTGWSLSTPSPILKEVDVLVSGKHVEYVLKNVAIGNVSTPNTPGGAVQASLVYSTLQIFPTP
jgi:hypothetical protein